MLSRVREAIFDRLAPWLPLTEVPPGEAARVLDLFAGSGSLGIEALSRGAAHARFVERGRAARETLAGNLAALGLESRAELTDADALGPRAAQADAPFDVVFFDPPYPLLDEPGTRAKLFATVTRLVLGAEGHPPALAEDGVLVFHAPTDTLEPTEFDGDLEVAHKAWGTTEIWFVGRRED